MIILAVSCFNQPGALINSLFLKTRAITLHPRFLFVFFLYPWAALYILSPDPIFFAGAGSILSQFHEEEERAGKPLLGSLYLNSTCCYSGPSKYILEHSIFTLTLQSSSFLPFRGKVRKLERRPLPPLEI